MMMMILPSFAAVPDIIIDSRRRQPLNLVFKTLLRLYLFTPCTKIILIFLSYNNNMFFVAEDLGHGNQFPSPLVIITKQQKMV